MQICDLVTISYVAPGRNCRCQSKSGSSRPYNILLSRWNRFRRSRSMSRSCLSERLFWETSCHAPDCLKVCDSCMVTAWMQNLRIMPFLHRANEVDEYMLKLKFQDCAYCKEGWFGVQTGKDKSRLPGGIESQAFQKTNFCQALETEWLEPNKPICENCLIEAKMRAKAGMPKEPFRPDQRKSRRSRRNLARDGRFDIFRRRTLIAHSTSGQDFYLV